MERTPSTSQELIPMKTANKVEQGFNALTAGPARGKLRGLVNRLNDEINYNALFEHYESLEGERQRGVPLRSTLNGLNYLWQSSQMLTPDRQFHMATGDIGFLRKTLQTLEPEWRKNGLLQRESPITEKTTRPDANLENLSQLLDRYEDMCTTIPQIAPLLFREVPIPSLSHDVVGTIRDMIQNGLELFNKAQGVLNPHDIDPRLIAATMGFLERRIKALESSLVTPVDRNKQPEITGFSTPSESTLIVEEEEFFGMPKLIPHVFLGGLTRIERLDPNSQTQIGESTDVAGLYTTYDQDAPDSAPNIRLWVKPYIETKYLENTEGMLGIAIEPEFIKTIVRMGFVRIAAHEVAHHIHHVFLGYDQMKAWLLIHQDGFSVSEYVEDHRGISNASALREDFADSWGLFAFNPYWLSRVSPSRFEFFRDICETNLPSEQRQEWRESFDTYMDLANEQLTNISAEDIVQFFFSKKELGTVM